MTSPESALRRGFLGLGALTTLGLVLELITEHHWKGTQLIAWGLLALGALALGLLLGAPSARRVQAARVVATLVIVGAAVGIWQHIAANHNAGPLDYRYTQTWDGMSPLAQWWTAARKGVGPSPPLAPGALALVGLCILLATVRHPALSDHTTTRTSPG